MLLNLVTLELAAAAMVMSYLLNSGLKKLGLLVLFLVLVVMAVHMLTKILLLNLLRGWVLSLNTISLIREYQRLKDDEQKQLGWSAKRELAKINYHIHTDAIKQNLIPPQVTAKQKSFIYADEADLLNVALFGQTAKQWRQANPDLKDNIREITRRSISSFVCLIWRISTLCLSMTNYLKVNA